MDVAIAIMALIVALASAAFTAFIVSGAKEKERRVAGFSRIDRSVGAKLELMASILKKLVPTPSALIIVLTLAVALAGMAVLSSESRSQSIFTVPVIRTGENMTMIKLVNAVSVDDILNAIKPLIQNVTDSCKVAGIYLIKVAEEPIHVEGVRTPKLVVVGINSCCEGRYLVKCEALDTPNPPFTCASEDDLLRYLYIDGELPVLPIEAFIGNEPVFPPFTSVIVASLDDASRLLGYGEAMANVVLIHGYVSPSAVKKVLGESLSEVWFVGENGALIMTSRSVSTLKEVVSAIILSVAVAVVVSSATRSMTPRVEEVAGRLMISGFPSWGGTIVYYVVVALCSVIAITMYAGIAVVARLSTSVGHLILVVAFVLASLINTPRIAGLATSDDSGISYLSAKIDGCSIDRLLEDIVSAIKRTEFFVIEELTVKRSDDSAFIRSKSIFSETWGIGVDIEVLISSLSRTSCRVEVRASDWSIEEISATLTGSVRSLAMSRIRSVIELWRLGYSRSH